MYNANVYHMYEDSTIFVTCK